MRKLLFSATATNAQSWQDTVQKMESLFREFKKVKGASDCAFSNSCPSRST